jgi:hypothetical protein
VFDGNKVQYMILIHNRMHSIKINGKVAPEVKYYLIKIYGRIGVKF